MGTNEPKRHHYVPQFYLRRFASPDDKNKVMVLERHRDVVVVDRKSIEGIGYEEGLHDFDANGTRTSIERDLNTVIETPFSKSSTWQKISTGICGDLDASDRLPLYGFARHLQRRNVETLRFIEAEHARFLSGEADDLSDDERAMHERFAASPGAAHALFRAGAMDTMLPDDADLINVILCQAPLALRSSTNPAIVFSQPGTESIYGPMFKSLRTWWLTLDRHWGVFIIAGGPPGFSSGAVEADLTRVVNRRYLVQVLQGGARYLLADDPYLGEDLEWAGFTFAQQTMRGFRYLAAPMAGS